MALFSRFYQWLDLRREEARVLWLSFSGAFLVMAYLILARSLREALYLDAFNVKTLPFMTLTYVVFGIPTAVAFSYFLARHYAQGVLKKAVLIGIAGLLLIWTTAHLRTWMIIPFYLWTALLGIILSSGLWLVIAEHFHVGRARSLYGWVSAGGTLGAMMMGTSLVPLAKKVPILKLMPGVIILLALFYIVLALLPRPEGTKSPHETEDKGRMSFTEGIGLVLDSPYLSAIALLVFSATLASTLLDYQFKEYVQHLLKEKAAMVRFFGGFYGWAGAFSLLIQIVVTPRLLGKAGLGWTLSILPLMLISGSSAFFLLPSFILATGMRGLDQSLRKSFHRSAIEVLYVLVPTEVRKKTKTLIDSVLDWVAEGVGALIIFFLVTLANIPSRYLSVFIISSAALLLYRVIQINRQYYEALIKRIQGKGEELQDSDAELPIGGDLFVASFRSIDLKGTLKKRGKGTLKKRGIIFKDLFRTSRAVKDEGNNSTEQISRRALESKKITELTRLLVEDDIYDEVCAILAKRGSESVAELVKNLLDEDADFVIRRRIPKILAKVPAVDPEEGLFRALRSQTFEVRYRAAIALMKRYQLGYPHLPEETRKEFVWQAIRFEINHEQPVWEMQTINDSLDESESDDFPRQQLQVRGQLSLEHVFRMLGLIFDPKLIGAVYQGLAMEKTKFKSFSLEYLELVLPDDIREKLWLFIGDIADFQKQDRIHHLEEIADELLEIGATLQVDKETIRKIITVLEDRDKKNSETD